jgi:hypothetical protein
MNQRRFKMNLRNLFRVIAVVLILGSLAWLFAPQAASAGDLDSYGLYVIQQLGVSNLALGVLFFLVSGMAHSPARQAVVTTVILHQLVSGIVNLLAVIGSVVPAGTGWFGVALNFLFVLAFGYLRFVRPEIAGERQPQT